MDKTWAAIHVAGTFIGLVANFGFLVIMHRRAVRRDFKIDLLWAHLIKEKDLNGDKIEE